jgi:hypothetical protein
MPALRTAHPGGAARRPVPPLVMLLLALVAALGVATPATARAATPAAAPRAMPCAPGVRACMVISRHQAWLADGAGHVILGPVPARGGTAHAPTPVGTFHVLFKDAHYFSKQFQAPMPYAVFFYPGDAFHADNTAVNSNGCIHLPVSVAQRFYAALHVGDEVQIRQN